MADLRPKYQNIEKRKWKDVRDAWLAHVPVFNAVGARPDPGLERLEPLREIVLPEHHGRFPDIQGLRTNMLWEAVFLFHKCAHSHLAAQRLGALGMHSWCMFNAYHSAYIGARGIMAALGVGFPFLPNGGQLLIDVFPRPQTSKDIKKLDLGEWQFAETLIVRMPRVDQQGLWQGFQRVLQMSAVECWDGRIRQELLDLRLADITKPRNSYLYKTAFWPGGDLVSDGDETELDGLVGTSLDSEAEGFLLRLSFCIYRLFDQLINDIAELSGPIRAQVNGSRLASNPAVADLIWYNKFVAQTQSSGASA